MDVAAHRRLLDAFGGLESQAIDVAILWSRASTAEVALDDHRALMARAEAERDYLEHAAEELRALNPIDGEEAKLASSSSRPGPATTAPPSPAWVFAQNHRLCFQYAGFLERIDGIEHIPGPETLTLAVKRTCSLAPLASCERLRGLVINLAYGVEDLLPIGSCARLTALELLEQRPGRALAVGRARDAGAGDGAQDWPGPRRRGLGRSRG